MPISFNQVITDEAVTYARVASVNAGWYLTPIRWAISSSSGELTTARTTASMYTPWIQQPFSGIYASGTNRLLHSVVIPPDAYDTEMTIAEIYFIYQDYYGNEFLYAIAQPTSTLTFSPGVSQSYSFAFTLNNTNVADTFTIDYTYPQDIEDHNQREDAHSYLLARDGSRTATGILTYENELNFSNPRQIVDKEYTDNVTDSIQNSIDTMYCPPGSMMWWPKSTAPSGWLIRDGSAYSRTTYANLFKVIGTTFGSGNGSTTFNVPDDRGRFIRGYKSGTSASFGQAQAGGLPNITGSWVTSQDSVDSGNNVYWTGAMYFNSNNRTVNGPGDHDNWHCRAYFDASRSNKLYGAASEVRPLNRNYLPIIKY